MEGILAITFIFGGGSLFLLAISPVGRALAERIRGGAPVSDDTARRLDESHQVLLDEMEHLRQDMIEMQERIDFAERLLARTRESLPRIESPEEGPGRP